jgi:DNA-binding protein HU-beta
MNKHELIQAVAERLDVSGEPAPSASVVRQAGLTAGELLEVIKDAMARGEKVSLSGFGTFEPVERNARQARNPATGEQVQVPAKTVVRFRPATALQDAANGGSSDS